MKKVEASQVCRAFNMLREEHSPSATFTRTEMMELLANASIAYGKMSCCIDIMADLGIIKRTKKNQYSFTSEPVYVGKFETYLNKCRAKFNTTKSTPKEAQPNCTTEMLSESEVIENAIRTLKETGDYRILKKVVTITWEEV